MVDLLCTKGNRQRTAAAGAVHCSTVLTVHTLAAAAMRAHLLCEDRYLQRRPAEIVVEVVQILLPLSLQVPQSHCQGWRSAVRAQVPGKVHDFCTVHVSQAP